MKHWEPSHQSGSELRNKTLEYGILRTVKAFDKEHYFLSYGSAHGPWDGSRSHLYNARKIPRLLNGCQSRGGDFESLSRILNCRLGGTMETKFLFHAAKETRGISPATSICINNRPAWKYIQCFPFEAIDRSRHADRSPREVRRDRLIDCHVSWWQPPKRQWYFSSWHNFPFQFQFSSGEIIPVAVPFQFWT